MAVASHPSSSQQQQFEPFFSNGYTPPSTSQSGGFFAGADEASINTSQPDFTFTSGPSRLASVASWAQTRPLAIPRSAPSFNFSTPATTTVEDVPLPPAEEQVPDLMNDHQWQQRHPQGHSTYSQSHQCIGRLPTHQRNPSLSSLGSAGPSSPYTQTSSTPRIAVSDSDTDGLADFASQDAMGSIYPPKRGMHVDSFHSQYPSSLSHTKLSSQTTRNHSCHGSKGTLLPPGDYQHLVSSNPVSVASSIAGDSPATPSTEENLHTQHQLPQHRLVSKRQSQSSFNPNVPKLDRTMTDVYSDELYNPNFSITTTVSPSTPTSAVSPNSDVFSQRIHAANSQHLSATHSPATPVSRDRSPFRHGSPLAPLSHELGVSRGSAATHPASQPQQPSHQARQFGKEGEVATPMMHQQHQHQQMSTRMQQCQPQVSLKTISPKDALLEFSEPSDGADFPLFSPQQDGSHHFLGMENSPPAPGSHTFGPIPVTAQDTSFSSFVPTPAPSPYGYMTRDNDGDINIADDHSRIRRQHQENLPTSPQKPTSSLTGRGAFSCTYQGCPYRFETAALLQKHKREGHRQAHGLGGARRDTILVSGVTNTQNGPHRCTQVNPSTGKPCNIKFSRPYDLTRHEDTIHNPKKKKVTCPACTDKKQFSRGDALSRHYRVCHPELTPPGKRRGGVGRG